MTSFSQKIYHLAEFHPKIVRPGNPFNSQLNLSCNPECSVLTDFSQYYKKINSFVLFTPISEMELIELILLLNKFKIAYRIRGNGHSLNSSSLPRHEEVLISTKNLKQLDLSNQKSGYIKAGSGWSLHQLNYLLRSNGCELPVVSDGFDLGSPTIAGFIVGGGISSSSIIYGGFWNNVVSITIFLPAKGKCKLLSSDKDFRLLFGNPSCIPLILSVELKVIETNSSKFSNKKLSIPRHYYTSRNNPIWFNYYCRCEDTYILHEKFLTANQAMLSYWRPIEIFEFSILNNEFVPPNVFEKTIPSFARVGIWGVPFNRTNETMSIISSAFSFDLPMNFIFNKPSRVDYKFSKDYLL